MIGFRLPAPQQQDRIANLALSFLRQLDSFVLALLPMQDGIYRVRKKVGITLMRVVLCKGLCVIFRVGVVVDVNPAAVKRLRRGSGPCIRCGDVRSH